MSSYQYIGDFFVQLIPMSFPLQSKNPWQKRYVFGSSQPSSFEWCSISFTEWRDFISEKLGTNIHHASGNCWNCFDGQRSRSQRGEMHSSSRGLPIDFCLFVCCPLTPISIDAMSVHSGEFEWNLARIFTIWVGIAESVFKVRGQKSRSWPQTYIFYARCRTSYSRWIISCSDR